MHHLSLSSKQLVKALTLVKRKKQILHVTYVTLFIEQSTTLHVDGMSHIVLFRSKLFSIKFYSTKTNRHLMGMVHHWCNTSFRLSGSDKNSKQDISNMMSSSPKLRNIARLKLSSLIPRKENRHDSINEALMSSVSKCKFLKEIR